MEAKSEDQEWTKLRQKVAEYVPTAQALNTYVVFNTKHRCWWKAPMAGMTRNLLDAHVYTHEEAQELELGSYDRVIHVNVAMLTNWPKFISDTSEPPSGTVTSLLYKRDEDPA